MKSLASIFALNQRLVPRAFFATCLPGKSETSSEAFGEFPRSSFSRILPLVFAFGKFCGVSRKAFFLLVLPSYTLSLCLEKSLPGKRTLVTRHGDSRSLILGGWHVWYKIWYLILIGLQWSLPYVGGRQCFETSSFVRANSRGLVTGGRRLPDDGGISLERDGLRTHQPNQSWQNYGHACIAFFLSCLLATFTFFIPKYTKWFLRSQILFPTLLTPWSESTLQLPSIISELFWPSPGSTHTPHRPSPGNIYLLRFSESTQKRPISSSPHWKT